MEHYLYQDLYQLEEHHWWHQAKRRMVLQALSWCENHRGQPFSKSNINSPIKPIAIDRGERLLDIGCGTGKNLESFAVKLPTFGTDMSTEALAFCKKRGLTQLKQSNGITLPYADNHFTVATALDVVEHADDKQLLSEAYRVLKPGGYLIVTVPAFQFLWSKWDEVLHHKRRYTTASLTKVTEQAGFTVLKKSYAYSFLVIPVLIIRSLKQLLSKNEYQSDFKLSHPAINALMKVVTTIEQKLIWWFGIPFGTSVMMIAQKPVSSIAKATVKT